jgi:hypothetical protein
MENRIPNGPYDNPRVDDGTYESVIDHVVKGSYGKDNQPYVKVVFRLTDMDLYFASNFYFPATKPKRTEQRLSRFCSILGIDRQAFDSDPDTLTGRSLRLQIGCLNPPGINGGRAYYDVLRFLPVKEQPKPLEV